MGGDIVIVSDVMTSPVQTIGWLAPLSRAVNMMANNSIGAIVIVDDDNIPWSIITESDVIRILSKHSLDDELSWLWIRPLHSFKLNALHTIDPNDKIADAIQRMAAYRIRRLPVVRKEELIGLVTERDVLDRMATKSTRFRV